METPISDHPMLTVRTTQTSQFERPNESEPHGHSNAHKPVRTRVLHRALSRVRAARVGHPASGDPGLARWLRPGACPPPPALLTYIRTSSSARGAGSAPGPLPAFAPPLPPKNRRPSESSSLRSTTFRQRANAPLLVTNSSLRLS